MTKTEIEAIVFRYVTKSLYNVEKESHEVRDRIWTTVKRLIAISATIPLNGTKDFKFGMSQKVNIEMASLRNDIKTITLNHIGTSKTISNNLNKALGIEPTDWNENEWIDSDRYGKSYNQRLATYTNRIKYEMEAFIAVGLFDGLNGAQISDWFMSNINSPHTVPKIMDAFGFASVRASSILRVGVGGITSAYKSIGRLNEDTLLTSYNLSNGISWGAKGLRKYIITAADSTVCATCAGNVGVTFPADEYVVLVHNRCRCKEIPILV